MIKAAKIASELCNKEVTPEDAYKVLMSLKLSRLAHSAKFDSFVDLIGYTEGWWNYLQEKQSEDDNTPTRELPKNFLGKVFEVDADVKDFIHLISNSVGEVITEYHWREACALLTRMKTKK